MADSYQHSSERFFDFFGTRISGLGVESQAVYRRALRALDGFLTGHDLRLDELSETMVLDWAAELLADGFSFNSAVQFVDVLSSLCNAAIREGMLPASEAVKAAKARILAYRPERGVPENQQVLKQLLVLLRKPASELGPEAKYRDVLLFSLLNGCLPPVDVAVLKKNELDGCDESSVALAARNVGASRRLYVFDLSQPSLTPRQLREDVNGRVLSLMQHYVDARISSVEDALYSFWVLLALKCGSTCSVALGCVPAHNDLYLPPFVLRGNAGGAVRQDLMAAVSPLIVSNPLRWYAMHLRRNVSYDDIKAAVKGAEGEVSVAELYYPCEAIAKKVGKKLVYQNQPFIRDVVFFRIRATDIRQLFRLIGDRAWCYRVSSIPGAPYAVIPQSEFMDFQTAVGQFTEATEILPPDVPAADEEVVVVGSMWGERKGRFERSVTHKSGKILYRVILSPDSGFAFRVDVDPRNVKPV